MILFNLPESPRLIRLSTKSGLRPLRATLDALLGAASIEILDISRDCETPSGKPSSKRTAALVRQGSAKRVPNRSELLQRSLGSRPQIASITIDFSNNFKSHVFVLANGAHSSCSFEWLGDSFGVAKGLADELLRIGVADRGDDGHI
jgi:hypothetical protein